MNRPIGTFSQDQDLCGMKSENNEASDHRQLVFTAKQSKNLHGEHLYRKVIVEAKHGTIISMHGDLQDHFRHRVPNAKHIDTSRISLTFRKFK